MSCGERRERLRSASASLPRDAQRVFLTESQKRATEEGQREISRCEGVLGQTASRRKGQGFRAQQAGESRSGSATLGIFPALIEHGKSELTGLFSRP